MATHENYDCLFSDGEEMQPATCNCGRGFCPAHGTFHFNDAVEGIELMRRIEMVEHGTRGGKRVVRKRIDGRDDK